MYRPGSGGICCIHQVKENLRGVVQQVFRNERWFMHSSEEYRTRYRGKLQVDLIIFHDILHEITTYIRRRY